MEIFWKLEIKRLFFIPKKKTLSLSVKLQGPASKIKIMLQPHVILIIKYSDYNGRPHPAKPYNGYLPRRVHHAIR